MSQQREEKIENEGKELSARGVALPAEMHQHPEEEDDETGGNFDDDQGEVSERESNVGDDTTQPNSKAVEAAVERANNESQVLGGRPVDAGRNLTPGTTKHTTGQRGPVLKDVDKMSREEMIAEIKRLQEQQQSRAPGVPIQKAIRWNNGSDPNIQGGDVVSARDTGSISVYGFGRRPLTFYPGQWVSLAHYMPSILHFIEERLGPINEYVEKRLGNESKSLSPEDVKRALDLFMVEHSGEGGESEGDEDTSTQARAQGAGEQ